MTKGQAFISDCGKYRYSLTRYFGVGEGTCTFIMLNPSTADASQDDPTIRRCIRFARELGSNRLKVVNLFAFRATNPKELLAQEDPVGELNMEYVREAALSSKYLIAAWGAHGKLRDQDLRVMEMLKEMGIKPQCLGVTKQGQPRHPLYLPANSKLRYLS
jgi:hypothetical protein